MEKIIEKMQKQILLNKLFLLILISTLFLSACVSEKELSGKREKILLNVEGEVIIDSKLGRSEINIPTPYRQKNYSGNDLINIGYNFARKLKQNYTVRSKKIAKKWKRNFYNVNSPIIVDNTVYSLGFDSKIMAYNLVPNKITHKWSKKYLVGTVKGLKYGGVTYKDNVIYVTNGSNYILAVSATTGSLIWKKDLKQIIVTNPKIIHDEIFITTINNKIYSLNKNNGSINWFYSVSDKVNILKNPAPIVASIKHNIAIVPNTNGKIYAFDITSKKILWQKTLEQLSKIESSNYNFSDINANIIIDGNYAYAVGYSSYLYKIKIKTGEIIWTQPIATVHTPILIGDYLYILDKNRILYAVNKNKGLAKWKTELSSYCLKCKKLQSPILVNGKIIITSSEGKALVVSAQDGKVEKDISIPNNVFAKPVIIKGRMYFINNSGKLYEYY